VPLVTAIDELTELFIAILSRETLQYRVEYVEEVAVQFTFIVVLDEFVKLAGAFKVTVGAPVST